jgi:hypothetical protein
MKRGGRQIVFGSRAYDQEVKDFPFIRFGRGIASPPINANAGVIFNGLRTTRQRCRGNWTSSPNGY